MKVKAPKEFAISSSHTEVTKSGGSMFVAVYRCAQMLWGRLAKLGRKDQRQLRLCENLSLGECRFVAVLEYQNLRFLLGGTSNSVTLLAELGSQSGEPSFQSEANGRGAPQILPLERGF